MRLHWKIACLVTFELCLDFHYSNFVFLRLFPLSLRAMSAPASSQAQSPSVPVITYTAYSGSNGKVAYPHIDPCVHQFHAQRDFEPKVGGSYVGVDISVSMPASYYAVATSAPSTGGASHVMWNGPVTFWVTKPIKAGDWLGSLVFHKAEQTVVHFD